MASSFSTCILPDGAKLAYEILGSYNLGRSRPIILIPGMTMVRVDYERLTQSLIRAHPVLIYDHRGMGNSSLTPPGNEEISIELLAKDLVALIKHVQWKEVALVGYSMGGVVAQQMLVLPFHPTHPVSLPCHISHLVLACTRSVVHAETGLKVAPASVTLTREERIAAARRIVGACLDPNWIEQNTARFEYVFRRATNPLFNRPSPLIAKQGAALKKFDFADLLQNISRDVQIMVVHGQLDKVIPFYCGEETQKLLPWARFIEKGDLPGQIPSMDFGHFWFEYFDIQVWHDAISKFVTTDSAVRSA
ncbi:hypothetical protein D9619_005421 [Psilocybe cf. subviscida]|uniref:AB hydrolase-1 domain-containing protein n=1 Tax=Psilocybe cf. subviscida TaxID=2480587 RepID=A0A8H5FB77_9AGAR|nr:hypothetical protein D9619_005421 [Psilocybe cf. subviscida]